MWKHFLEINFLKIKKSVYLHSQKSEVVFV